MSRPGARAKVPPGGKAALPDALPFVRGGRKLAPNSHCSGRQERPATSSASQIASAPMLALLRAVSSMTTLPGQSRSWARSSAHEAAAAS